jgi:L-lactate dehydrogenase
MEPRKIAIIGDGAVGSSIAYTLMLGHAAKQIVLIDVNKQKAEGDALDMADGMSFLSVPKLVSAGDYAAIEGAHMVIITAGTAQKPGETRIDLLRRNAAIMSSILEETKKHLDPEALVLIVSNPVDILTYFAYKKLGRPANLVFGSGTVLDTSRLKTAISEDTHIDSRSIHTMVVGEHGDSEVAVWSATSVGGLSLTEYCAKCGRCKNHNMARLNALHEKVRGAAYEIIAKKGATNYAVALAVSRIVSAVFSDEHSVLTVSSYLKDEFDGAVKDVCMSVPSVVGASGVERILRPDYTEEEKTAIIASAKGLKDKLKDLPL